MRIGPPRRKATIRPWALLSPAPPRGVVVTTEHGSFNRQKSTLIHLALAGLKGHAVYVNGSLSECRRIGGDARAWEGSFWRGRTVAMTHTPTGTTVRSLRGTLTDDPDPAGSMAAFTDWIQSFGVGLGSMSSMARNLWRVTLPSDLEVDTDPDLARAALFGGRQGVRLCKSFRHQVLLDLKAAYPVEMAALPYALTLRRVHKSTDIDPDRAGLVRCAVHIPPHIAYGLLPERFPGDNTIIGYRRGRVVRGIWTWREVACAVACGAEMVVVEECWAPATETDLFSAWWAAIGPGRELPGGAGRLSKATGNALWGTFAIRGESFVMRWDDPSGNRPPIITPGRQIPNPYIRTIHLAAETTARVRARLLWDILAPGDIPPPVHVDTDGVIIRKRADVAHLLGDGPGQWRIKKRMRVVEVKAPQVYRWQDSDAIVKGGQALWHYSVSGVPAGLAQRVFDRTPRSPFSVEMPPGWEDSRPDLHTDTEELIA